MFVHIVCLIWPIDRSLSAAANLGYSGPGSDGNEGVPHIPQIFKSGALRSFSLMSFQDACCGHHHHHHVVPLARISLTLSCHPSLSFIASGRSSELHRVFSHSCCIYVRAGRPAFAWPYAGVHRSTSLMSSSLLLQQCPACLVRLAWIVFVMGGRWPYSWWLLGCYCQNLFNIARSILV